MKITRVEAIPLSIPFTYGAQAMTLGTGASWKALDFCLVRVETDAGLVGWGDAFAYSCRRATVASVAGMVAVADRMHRPCLDTEALECEHCGRVADVAVGDV